MKIWTCGNSPWSGFRNAWTRNKNVNRAGRRSNIRNFFCRRDANYFLSRLVTMDETWLYIQGPGTKQQSTEWRHSVLPRPKYSECKNSLEKFSLRFFGIKNASSLLIIFQRSKLSTRSITQICWSNWRTFWRKKAAGISPKWSWSCTTMTRLTGHFQSRRNWPTWDFNVLISHPNLRICPRRTTTCPMHWKNNRRVDIFHPTQRSLLPRDLVVLANFWFFFWVACKGYRICLRSVLSIVGSILKKYLVCSCRLSSASRARALSATPHKELWGQNNIYVILNWFCPV